MQSPLITFVRVSSPMYWPSNFARSCAHAALASPVASRRPNPSHLGIPFFPFGFRLQATDSNAVPTDADLCGINPSLHPAGTIGKRVAGALSALVAMSAKGVGRRKTNWETTIEHTLFEPLQPGTGICLPASGCAALGLRRPPAAWCRLPRCC